MITVTDVTTEAPSAPSTPTVRPAEPTDDEPNFDPTTMLAVTWAEPRNDGPSITEYAVQYKVSVGTADFAEVTAANVDDEGRSAIITGLDDNTSYQVQVMATNDEGESIWSSVGTGKTRFANTRPDFSKDNYTLRVKENTRSGQSTGRPVAATDDDGHRLTYTLEGVHKEQFTIEGGSGHIRTRASLDLESRSGYSLTVRATDTEGGSAAVSVTIIVENEIESPSRPVRPTVSGVAGSTSSVRVTWDAPSNDGRPPIVDYDVQYREVGGGFIFWNHYGTDTSTIITDLRAGTPYEVQVQATNLEGTSGWSASGSGAPDPDVTNNPPVFPSTAPTLEVAENTEAGTDIGNPVTATDRDRDTLTYSLEGTDAALFDIVSTSGQIQTKEALNYEEKPSHSVTVRAADDRGGSDTIAVRITVTDVGDEPPSKPDAPTVTATSDSDSSLDVSWVAPENPGPPITDYDYRYVEETAGIRSWNPVDDTTITGRTVTISELTPDTPYLVQVRATNADGTTEWSESGRGSTNPLQPNNPPVFGEGASAARNVPENASAGTPIGDPVAATDADNDTLTYSLEGTDAASFGITPATGQITTRAALDAGTKDTYTVTVVASDGTDEDRITVTITVTSVQDRCGDQGAVDPANIDLASDCEALLDARDVLVGLGGPLNWSASTPIAQWDGVTVDGTPMRVTTLDLRKMRLKGMISSHLSRVTALRELYLQDNHLTGPMPSELGSMTALTHLYADNNDLSGAIPSQMGSMTELRELRLRSNDLSGPLPAALGGLTNLTYLLLSDNDLSGSIPSQIGDMSSLYWLDVGQNNISGTLPAELGNLSQLGRLYVYENDLTGSIPSTLGNLTGLTHIVAQENDLSGSIPVQLGNMSALVWMGLYDNDLSGAIPTQLSRLSNLQRLYLSNNDLTGTIPRELGQLSALTNLWLDDNGLSGTIPSELDQLTNLVRWRMRGQRLYRVCPRRTGCGSEYRL